MAKRKILVLWSVILVIASMSLMTAADTPSVLRVRLAADILNLDYCNQQSSGDTVVLQQVMEYLVQFDWEVTPLPVKGRIAKSYEISEDGREIVFYINEGIQFHGGYGELTAEDVAFSMNRIMDPAVGSRISAYYGNVETIEVVDPYTVKVTMKNTSANTFLQTLTWLGTSQITSKKAVEELGDDFNRHPIGTGPYEFVKWAPGTGVYLKKNEQYWGAPDWGYGEPAYDEVELLLIADDMIALDALETGEIDVVGIVGKGGIERARMIDGITLQSAVGGSWQHLTMFNHKREALSDVRVRRALAYAVDLHAIADRLGEMEEYYPSPFNPLVFASTDEFWTYDYDPQMAKDLLAEAGYGDSLTINLIYPPVYLWDDLALEMAHYWDAIGVDVDLEVVEYALYRTRRQSGDWDVFIASHTVFNPYSYAELYFSDTPRNYTGYANPQLDRIIEEAGAEPDLGKAEALWRQFQQIICEDVVGIYSPVQVAWVAISDKVEGVIAIPFSTDVDLSAARPAE